MLSIHWVGSKHMTCYNTAPCSLAAVYIMYLAEFSRSIAALLFPSMKRSVASLMSVLTMLVRPHILAITDEGVSS